MNEEDKREFQELMHRQAQLMMEVNQFGRRLYALEHRVAERPAQARIVTEKSAPEHFAAGPMQEPIVRMPEIPATPPPVPPAPAPMMAQAAPPVTPVHEPSLPPRVPSSQSPIPAPPVIPRLRPVPRVRLSSTPEAVPEQVSAPEPEFASAQAASSSPGTQPKAPAPEQVARGSFEMRLGTYWLVRIGIVMLLTSLVFFGNYAYQHYIPRFGPAGKITMLYLVSGGLLATGAWLQRKRESMRNYAQVLQAGGMAAVYFTTYAAHHFPALQIIKNVVLDGVLLFGWTSYIVWVADRKKSEVLAMFAVLLAYYTSVMTNAALFTLYSNLLLTAAAVFFLIRNRWATLSFASLAATYASYGFWRFFHAGEWNGAASGEHLWIGNGFLMGYWVLFTVAAFFSKHEQFNGAKRASFLTANNGAFFTAFVLTMFQAQQGGFWKFSLIYGAVLVALAVPAKRLLPDDKISFNAYLTQGLLLVTIGLIAHVTGFKLSLLLAAESVILLTIGQQMQSRVLQAGSLVASLLSVGWATVTMQPFDHNGLLSGAAVGALMLFNAFWLRKRTDFVQSAMHPRTVFYTVLALIMWMLTTWDNVEVKHRGLIVACECVAFLLAAKPLGNRVLQFGAYVFGGVSLGLETNILLGQYLIADRSARTGLLEGVIVGALFLFNALWEKRAAHAEPARAIHPPTTFYSVMAMLMWMGVTCVFTPPEYLVPMLAVEAAILTAAYYALRLQETALFGQAFLLLAQASWLSDTITNHPQRPWWNPVAVIALTLGLAAWWQRQKSILAKSPAITVWQGVQALAVVGLLFFWLEPKFAPPGWLASTSLLAIALTVYGALNRYWLLAAAGQFFLIVSGLEFFDQLAGEKPEWFLPLVPIAALVLVSFAAVQWFARNPETSDNIRRPVLGVGLAYRIMGAVMSLWWIHQYIPARQNVWVLALIGLALFLIAGWRKNLELLIFGAVFSAVGLLKFWVPLDGEETVYWPNLLAVLALLTQQQLVRQRGAKEQIIPAMVHPIVIGAGGLSLWIFASRWILLQGSGYYLTVGWAVLAFVLFEAGMLLRERVYRWLGLGLLACALGRVVIFDVWKLETIYRILSFMALGVVLLVLGFIYNRYQEKIREWL